jgi:protein-S-isoprenylcysteine O-methyltransferase Ste14
MSSTLKRTLVLAYGVGVYLMFFGVFLYAIGFLGNFLVPKTIDSGEPAPLAEALVINGALLGLFAIQHSVMARRGFKRWWTQFIPRPIERSTYVLATNLCFILLFWQWRPMGGVIWEVEAPLALTLLHGLYGFGWFLVFLATCLINHFDLFGLRQPWLYFRGREYTSLRFRTPALYKLVRHPLYIGWFCVFWATPAMSAAHHLFALATTGYILIAILQFEERDLITEHGPKYAEYRRRVPMLVPFLRTRRAPIGTPRPTGA